MHRFRRYDILLLIAAACFGSAAFTIVAQPVATVTSSFGLTVERMDFVAGAPPDGQTQSFWIEHVQHSSLQARDELCELAFKLSREKHFQRVYFPQGNGVTNSVSAFKPENWQPSVLMVKSTKVST